LRPGLVDIGFDFNDNPVVYSNHRRGVRGVDGSYAARDAQEGFNRLLERDRFE